MMDGPIPRPPRDGCLLVIVFLLLLAGGVLGIVMGDPVPEKKLCQCGGDECPYTDNHVPREGNLKAEMHYWSIE